MGSFPLVNHVYALNMMFHIVFCVCSSQTLWTSKHFTWRLRFWNSCVTTTLSHSLQFALPPPPITLSLSTWRKETCRIYSAVSLHSQSNLLSNSPKIADESTQGLVKISVALCLKTLSFSMLFQMVVNCEIVWFTFKAAIRFIGWGCKLCFLCAFLRSRRQCIRPGNLD